MMQGKGATNGLSPVGPTSGKVKILKRGSVLPGKDLMTNDQSAKSFVGGPKHSSDSAASVGPTLGPSNSLDLNEPAPMDSFPLSNRFSILAHRKKPGISKSHPPSPASGSSVKSPSHGLSSFVPPTIQENSRNHQSSKSQEKSRKKVRKK